METETIFYPTHTTTLTETLTNSSCSRTNKDFSEYFTINLRIAKNGMQIEEGISMFRDSVAMVTTVVGNRIKFETLSGIQAQQKTHTKI